MGNLSNGLACRIKPLMFNKCVAEIALILIVFSTCVGCPCQGRYYDDEDVPGYLPAYAEWRFVCRQQSRYDAKDLPAKPSVGCAYDNLCDEKPQVLERLKQDAYLYSKLGTTSERHPERRISGEDLASGLVEKSFSAHEFEFLCEDAVEEGFDIVIISFHNDLTVMQGGASREVSATRSGAIIDAKSRQVIVPILVKYGTPDRTLASAATAPDAKAPTMEEIQLQFADEVASKLKTILSARGPATTNPSSDQGKR